MVGACIGFVGIIGVRVLVLGDSFDGLHSKFAETGMLETVGVSLLAILILLFSIFLQVLLHEGGHLVCGLATGYRFVSFRIFNLTFIRKDGKLCIKRFSLAGTGGQCLLTPPERPLEDIPTTLYNLGGVLANLLTAIQRRSIVRVGSNTPVPVDIRLICATNRNLSEMADKGEFREDLLYRINTIHLEIPALRERQEDIIPLAERFITRFCKQYGKPALRLDNAAREKLMLHPWSGNIRELEHAIEKAVIICDDAFLSAGLFQLQRRNEAPEMPAASTLEDMEKQMIRHTLDKCGGNLSAVASQLGITRQTLYNKMKKYGL